LFVIIYSKNTKRASYFIQQNSYHPNLKLCTIIHIFPQLLRLLIEDLMRLFLASFFPYTRSFQIFSQGKTRILGEKEIMNHVNALSNANKTEKGCRLKMKRQVF